MIAKYMSLQWGMEAIKNAEFKLLRPLEANDPYEMMGACKGTLSEKVRTELENEIRYGWLKESMNPLKVSLLPPLEDAVANAKMTAEGHIRRIIMERTIVQIQDCLLSFVDVERITPETDQLMWAHYADGGKGVRVWLDERKFPLSFPALFDVRYSNNRPVLNLNEMESWMDMRVLGGFIRDCFLTKSSAWAYEHEKRIIVNPCKCTSIYSRHDDLEFISFPREAIVRIDFGPKGNTLETKEEIARVKKMKEYECIESYLAVFSTEKYEYEYLQCSDRVMKALR